MEYKLLYPFAYEYLLYLDGVTDELIRKHLKPIYNKPNNLKTIYKGLVATAQNKQMSTKVIGNSIGGIDNLGLLLSDFNPKKVKENYSKNDALILLENIKSKLNPKGQIRTTSKSLWPQFCQSVIDSAYFLCTFKSAEDFFNWCDSFALSKKSKAALPLIISMEISGIGFPLACDLLKELGYINYGKPDVHIKEIFKGLNLIDPKEKSTLKQDYRSLQVMDEIADANNVSTYEIDKIFWLIGSGNFYLENMQIGRHRDDFIKAAKRTFK